MSEEIIKVEEKIKQSITLAEKYWGPITSNADQCVSRLSKFTTPFTSQTQYDEAYLALSEVKTVMDKVELKRKEITSRFDDLKKDFMEPEKSIKDSFANVKLLCDKWNQELANKAAAEKARIEREKNTKIEFSEFVSMLINRIEMFLTNTANGVESAMTDYFSKMTLETFEKDAEIIKAPRMLRQTKYEELFSNLPPFSFDNKLVDVIAEVDKTHSLEQIAKRYSDTMNPLMQPWIEKLDSKLQQLKEIASMGEQAKAEAEAKVIADAKIAKDEADARAKADADRKETELKLQAEQSSLSIQFEAQVATQQVDLPEGVRTNKTAVFDCADKDLLAKICELVFKVLAHPKHAGIYQKDKKGVIKTDESGNPLYADWLDSMLKFYAQNIEQQITGIKIVETVGTVTRKK